MSTLETRYASVLRSGRSILKDISIRLEPGELLAIVGPNGSGKSTLLRVLAGLWRTSSGEALLDGRAIATWPRRDLARRISFLPQDTRVDFAFTVRELVSMGRYPHRGRFTPETSADRTAIHSAMRQCDVVSMAHCHAHTLSGGERQRALLARCLAVEPDFVLLDEPTSNLDIEHSLDVLEICSALCRAGKAVAITTHDLNAVARFASSVALLRAGALVAYGSRAEVLTPSALDDVFGVTAELLCSRDDQPVYLFHRRSHQRNLSE